MGSSLSSIFDDDGHPSAHGAVPGAWTGAAAGGSNGQLQHPSIVTPPTPASPPATSPSRSSSMFSSLSSSVPSYFIPRPRSDHAHVHPAKAPSLKSLGQVSNALLAKGLPIDIVYDILEYAEMYLECGRMCSRPLAVASGSRDPRSVSGISGQGFLCGQEDELAREMALDLRFRDGNVWYLASEPIGCMGEGEGGLSSSGRRVGSGQLEGSRRTTTKAWLRKIRVSTLSKDQGWSTSNQHSYGTYDNSFTWFEISLLRDGREVPGSRLDIQHNVHAGQYFKEHVNVLDVHHDVVKMARTGDRVILWARALYPGWRNNVREATLTVYTAPFPYSL